ncbi:hypothetical protein [Micromonospora aurantiaca]|uniref:hypothetical protein n=1 Tax=Micromonospora aurantiaca (nom. illeg.) TaxID=47850 RepID=UPI001F0875DB|nr:hypothetical protein [Micromonospora aurantiaca]
MGPVSDSERLPRLLGVTDFHAVTGVYWYRFVDVVAGLAGALLVVVLSVSEARRGVRTGGVREPVPETNPWCSGGWRWRSPGSARC